MQLKSFFYFSSVFAVALGATVQDVLNDLNTVSTRMTTLDNAIKAFPSSGGSSAAFQDIHTDFINVQSAVDATTADVKATPPPLSETDGRSILTSFEAIEPIINDVLHQIVVKKPAFQALPIGGISGLVRQDLSKIATSTNAFEGAFLSLAPADLLSEGRALQTRIHNAFNVAIAAYN